MWFPLLQALCWLAGSLALSQPLSSHLPDAEGYHTPDAQLYSSCCPDLKFLLALAALLHSVSMTSPDAPPSTDLQRVHLAK